MTAPPAPRRFVAPFLGIALLFAALGPPVGAAAFVPLALATRTHGAAGAVALAALIASLFGHWILLLAAYAVGLAPAVTTGVLYAVWDALAPDRWPRALAAAVIGGFVAYAVALRLAAFGLSLDMMFGPEFDAPTVQSISATAPAATAPVSTGIGLLRAFVAGGAVAGFVCATAASLFGQTKRPARFEAGAGSGA